MGTGGRPLFVRGTTVDAARRFIERQKGTPAWDRFLADLGPVQLALVEQPVVRRRWYDLELYADVLEIAGRNLAPDDPHRFLTELGQFVMDDGVTTLYRAFFAIVSPSFVIRGSALFWRMFFKGNRLKVTGSSKKWVTVSVLDGARCWLPLCKSVSGGMLSALQHAGARDARLVHHHCQSSGGDRCDFKYVWR